MNREELEKRVLDLETRAAELQKEKEERAARKKAEERNNSFYKGNFKNMEQNKVDYRALAEGMKEKRTVQLQGTGAIEQMNGIWDLIKQREPLMDRVSYFRGPNAKTAIALLAARPAKPSKTSTANNTAYNRNMAVDNTQLLGVKEVTPYAWTSVLPVDYDTVTYSFSEIEGKIPGLLAEAFRTAMCDGMFGGDGTNGTIRGIFADGAILSDGSGVLKPGINNVKTTDAATGIGLKDLLDLALAVKDTDIANPVIIINPESYAAIAAAEGGVYDFVKEELIRNKSVEGIHVELTGKAPKFSAASEGDIVAWAGDLKNYGFAVADEVTIEPVKQVGDSNTYFQGIMSFTGDVIQPANVFGLGKAGV